MIQGLRGYGIVKGVRGQDGVNEEQFAEILVRISNLVKIAPEIYEMDINPLLGNRDRVVAVDARIRIEK
jgi:acetyltransferase